MPWKSRLATRGPTVDVGQVILTRPDVDADWFRHHVERISQVAKRVTTYVAMSDLALRASEQIWGTPRAGSRVLDLKGVDTINMSGVDKRTVLADIHVLLKQGLPPETRFGLQRIESKTGVTWLLADDRPSL